MIKNRVLFSAAFVAITFFIVMVSALRLSQPQLFQASLTKPVLAFTNNEASVSAQTYEEDSQIDYVLPYPGILPDHPLYWLKMIRDRINLMLTKDGIAKFELLMLYGDKRLGAGKALIVGNQDELGVSTISKAEKYLFKAHQEFKQLAQEDKIDLQIKQQFAKTFLKHQEVINKLLDQVDDPYKNTLIDSLELNQVLFQDQVNQFTPQIPESAEIKEATEFAEVK